MTTTPELSAPVAASSASFDVELIRADFPILALRRNGQPLVYIDNAATSQKPNVVLDTLDRFYKVGNANIHRGVYYLSEESTAAYEGARAKVQQFIHAADQAEIIFVRSTTEAINLVAHSYGRANFESGDEIIVSAMEHHSNIVPWQLVCEATGARLRVIPMTDKGELVVEQYAKLLSPRTKFVALVHVSNSLGTINPVKKMIAMAHAEGVPVLVDGAQVAPHMPIDVQDLDCDFYAISGHKMFGPNGIGVLYGKARHLDAMPPYQGGGDMIRSVTFEKTSYAPPPAKFAAGTPHIAGAIGLGAAVDYLEGIGWEGIRAHEADLLAYATESLSTVPGLKIIGTAAHKGSLVSFVLDGVHAHDIGTVVDQQGIAIRTGHHCTQPVMDRLGIPATARASFAFYNTRQEVDALTSAVMYVREVFR